MKKLIVLVVVALVAAICGGIAISVASSPSTPAKIIEKPHEVQVPGCATADQAALNDGGVSQGCATSEEGTADFRATSTTKPTKLVSAWNEVKHDSHGIVMQAKNDDGSTAQVEITQELRENKVQLASVVSGGTPQYAGCNTLTVHYYRTNNYWFTSTKIYTVNLKVDWCYWADVIDGTQIRHLWWFSYMTPGGGTIGNPAYQQYWSPYPGRHPHSSFIAQGGQYWRQCVSGGGGWICGTTEYPQIKIRANGNSTWAYDAWR